MADLKYIRTIYGEIIMFPPNRSHSEFKNFFPTSAGFIRIIDRGNNETISNLFCYGGSKSLNQKSDIEIDALLARKQILGY